MLNESLETAFQNGDVKTIQTLLNQKDINTQLIIAAWNDDKETFQELINKGADINAFDDLGYTFLHIAAQNGYLKLVKLLLENGADINAKNKYGETPLHLAADNGRLETVRLLLEKDADVNEQNPYGWTPLHFAVKEKHLETVRLLIEKKDKIDVKNGLGNISLYYAFENDDTEMARLLLEHGANISATISNNVSFAFATLYRIENFYYAEYKEILVNTQVSKLPLPTFLWMQQLDYKDIKKNELPTLQQICNDKIFVLSNETVFPYLTLQKNLKSIGLEPNKNKIIKIWDDVIKNQAGKERLDFIKQNNHLNM